MVEVGLVSSHRARLSASLTLAGVQGHEVRVESKETGFGFGQGSHCPVALRGGCLHWWPPVRGALYTNPGTPGSSWNLKYLVTFEAGFLGPLLGM